METLEACLQKAQNYRYQKRCNEAIASYSTVLEISPEHWQGQHYLGDCLLNLERWEEACVAYNQALNVNPDFVWAYHNLGIALVNLEQFEEAYECFEKVRKLNPNFWNNSKIKYFETFQCKLGDYLFKQQRWEDAVAVYQRVVALNPDFNLRGVLQNIKKSQKIDCHYLNLQIRLDQIDTPEGRLGEISSDKSSILGEKNWIYLNVGTNDLMNFHTGKRQLSSEQIHQWKEVLHRRRQWHYSLGINYLHLFVPNKISVYPEFFPYPVKILGERPILQLKKQCPDLFIYPLKELIQKKNTYRLYDKQDSHWNFWGCYFTYKLLCNLFDIPINNFLDSTIEITERKGDLGSKYGVKEKLVWKRLQTKSKLIYDNKVRNYGHQGNVSIFKNTSISQGKMIIFGDSFCDQRHPDKLSSLFAETLNEVHFIWTPWVDYDYVEEEKPDFVLTEMVERFMVRVPDDINHLPIDKFANEILQKNGVCT